MKTINSLILLILITIGLTAQETKKVKQKSEDPYYSCIEEFYVLKTDNSVKHGSFKKLGYKNCLVEEGQYVQGKKEGLWTEYFWRSKNIKQQGEYSNNQRVGEWKFYYKGENMLQAKGAYKNDLRVGIWEFYDAKGDLEQKYDFSTNKLLYFKKPEESKLHNVKTEKGIVKMEIDQPPLYIGGETEMSEQQVWRQMRYPVEAKEKGISGTVIISIFIDESGKAIDHSVKNGIGGGCDEESLRISKLLKDNWIPATKDGKAITAEILFPLSFNLRR